MEGTRARLWRCARHPLQLVCVSIGCAEMLTCVVSKTHEGNISWKVLVRASNACQLVMSLWHLGRNVANGTHPRNATRHLGSPKADPDLILLVLLRI